MEELKEHGRGDPEKMMGKMDQNGGGVVTLEELETAFSQRKGRSRD